MIQSIFVIDIQITQAIKHRLGANRDLVCCSKEATLIEISSKHLSLKLDFIGNPRRSIM